MYKTPHYWLQLATLNSQWTLAVDMGWTVAHEAATWGMLPRDFNQWSLTDYNGVTVARVAIERRDITEESYLKWVVESGLSEEVDHSQEANML
jgi:hypothetical protein